MFEMAMPFRKQQSEVVSKRIEWLRTIGISPTRALYLGLTREMPDDGFQVLVNQLLRERVQWNLGHKERNIGINCPRESA